MKNFIVGGCIVLAGWIPGPAQAGPERAGTTAANFLTIGSGPRVLGMGGATLALTNGLSSTPWNPAALGWVGQTELVLSHAGLADALAQEWIGLGGPMGAGFHWSISTLYQKQGSFEGRDAFNNSTGSFDASSMAVGGHLARSLGPHASLGFGGKWVHESMGSVTSGSGATFDAGLQVRMGAVGLGVAAQNIGGSMRFDGSSYPFPSNVGAGISLDHKATGLRADVDFNVPSAYYRNVRGGIEWAWRDRVALRAGYRKELEADPGDQLGGPSFGVGAGALGLWFDYAYLVGSAGEGQHRMGVSFRPGAMRLGDPFGQEKMAQDFDDLDKPAEKPKVAPKKTKDKK